MNRVFLGPDGTVEFSHDTCVNPDLNPPEWVDVDGVLYYFDGIDANAQVFKRPPTYQERHAALREET